MHFYVTHSILCGLCLLCMSNGMYAMQLAPSLASAHPEMHRRESKIGMLDLRH